MWCVACTWRYVPGFVSALLSWQWTQGWRKGSLWTSKTVRWWCLAVAWHGRKKVCKRVDSSVVKWVVLSMPRPRLKAERSVMTADSEKHRVVILAVNCCLVSGSRWVSCSPVWPLGCRHCRPLLLWWTNTMVFSINVAEFGPAQLYVTEHWCWLGQRGWNSTQYWVSPCCQSHWYGHYWVLSDMTLEAESMFVVP